MEIKKVVVDKPWGKFEQFTLNQKSTVKILTVEPGTRLSYQSHKNRDEFWRCIKGIVIAVIDDVDIALLEGDELWIPRGTKHRLVGGLHTGQILEISLGNFDEEDITRHEDDYGRAVK